eukprot:TRINITY_DN3176_c0_g1_i1.p1 TRINITY_DN3176_c0_g1~~TRINITY_DN3176_c0_g1_i1.p1  ORF type:complete len:519 (+),score=117.22 TRINITY_DN3176_c0_g1_i1:74-1558(+)
MDDPPPPGRGGGRGRQALRHGGGSPRGGGGGRAKGGGGGRGTGGGGSGRGWRASGGGGAPAGGGGGRLQGSGAREALKVAAASNAHGVAGALAAVARESEQWDKIEVDAVGAAALFAAVKAGILARRFIADEGFDLRCLPFYGDSPEGGAIDTPRLVYQCCPPRTHRGRPTLFKVAGGTNPRSTAGAIAATLRDGGSCALSALGAHAVEQAIHALALARSFLRDQGIDVAFRGEWLGGEWDNVITFTVESARRSGVRAAARPRDTAAGSALEWSGGGGGGGGGEWGGYSGGGARHGGPQQSPMRERLSGAGPLKVSVESNVHKLAGAIAGQIRDGETRILVDSIGANALFQAVKAGIIARDYLADDEHDVLCVPHHARGSTLSSGEGNATPRLLFVRRAPRRGRRGRSSDPLRAAGSSEPRSLAGAIAGHMRDAPRGPGEKVAVTALGAAAVQQVIQAIALARSFLKDDQIDLGYRASWEGDGNVITFAMEFWV